MLERPLPGFIYTRDTDSFWDKLPSAKRKREAREEELIKLAEKEPKKNISNEEYLDSLSDNERQTILKRVDAHEDFVIVKDGPLRSKPGLVGVWKQEAKYEWRQIGIYNYASYRDDGNYCYGITSGRTARVLLWMSSDVRTHYMSAFYSPEEWEYIRDERPTYEELLDAGVCFVSPGSLYHLVRNMPLYDIMFVEANRTIMGCLSRSTDPVDNAMAKPIFWPHQLCDMKDFLYSHPQTIIDCYFHELTVMRENTYYKCRGFFPRASISKEYDSTLELQRMLLAIFIYMFGIFKEYGIYKEEFIAYEKDGCIDRVQAEAAKYEKYIAAGGQIGVMLEWQVVFMTKESLDIIKESIEEHLFWYDEKLSLRAFLFGNVGNVKPLRQVMENPVYDDSNDGYWQEILYRYSDKVVRGTYANTSEKENLAFGKNLTIEEISDLKMALSIFKLTPAEFWSIDDKAFHVKYISVIKEEHPDQGGSDEYAKRINTTYEKAKNIRKIFG